MIGTLVKLLIFVVCHVIYFDWWIGGNKITQVYTKLCFLFH